MHKDPAPQNGKPRQRPSATASRATREAAFARDGQAVERARRAEQQVSLRTAHLRRLPWVRDVLEIQALILRREAWTYAQIAHTLEVDQTTAHALVDAGARLCMDEEPVTSLRVHLLRLDGMLQSWYSGAERPERSLITSVATPDERVAILQGDAVETKMARDNAYLVVQLLALQDRVGTWLATLPRRGQEVKDEDDHAEIKAILMRADEYGPPPGSTGSAPHGLPSLADWRPADVEEG